MDLCLCPTGPSLEGGSTKGMRPSRYGPRGVDNSENTTNFVLLKTLSLTNLSNTFKGKKTNYGVPIIYILQVIDLTKSGHTFGCI